MVWKPVRGAEETRRRSGERRRGKADVVISRYVLYLMAEPGGCSLARAFARDCAKFWEVQGDDMQLVISELFTNAVKAYGLPRTDGGHDFVHLACVHRVGLDCVTVAVSDWAGFGRIAVPPQRVADDEENGRGLFIIDDVAVKWGVNRDGDKKTVWATVQAPDKLPTRRDFYFTSASVKFAETTNDVLLRIRDRLDRLDSGPPFRG
jgi:anti-sigma regulatory factor (Ser/Thr protein kinase)